MLSLTFVSKGQAIYFAAVYHMDDVIKRTVLIKSKLKLSIIPIKNITKLMYNSNIK